MIQNRITRIGITFLLIVALITTGLFSYPNTSYAADELVRSEESYYHLDMGVQVAYYGSKWSSSGYNLGDTIYSTTANVGGFRVDLDKFDVVDVYPLESTKGSAFPFDSSYASTNIPDNLGTSKQRAYDNTYKDYVSKKMTLKSYSPQGQTTGHNISFTYDAQLASSDKYDVVARYMQAGKGAAGRAKVYEPFGGNSSDAPAKVSAAIERVLQDVDNGVDIGENRLYLVFCPMVIEYKIYVPKVAGVLTAALDAPGAVETGEEFTVKDVSAIDPELTVTTATLEKSIDGSAYSVIANWNGTGIAGENTSGTISQSSDVICSITYRMTVNSADGQTATATKTVTVNDGREIDANADLVLPAYTYEGHPTPASDQSTFTVDGEYYSAKRAYEENIADSSYRVVPSSDGNAHKTSSNADSGVMTWYEAGIRTGRLDVTCQGNRLIDTEDIEVRKTPYIEDTLGGTQKQNRKQTLKAHVAIYPDRPIVEWSMEVESLDSGEKIVLDNDTSQENTASIKTRTIAVDDASDKYFTEFDLQFLTKTPDYDKDNPAAVERYKYTIYVKDSKGDEDTVTKEFTVKPDIPPQPVITLQDTFLREQGSNTSEITMEDVTILGDGDQVDRTWYMAARSPLTNLYAEGWQNLKDKSSYADISFGSGIKVQCEKEGVGNFDVKLYLKEVWTEATLEEYVTEDDYLTAAAIKGSKVDNISPVVSMEPVTYDNIQIDLLVKNNIINQVEQKINALRQMLLENGIDAGINLVPTAEPYEGDARKLFTTQWPIATDCSCGNCGRAPITDSEYMFIVKRETVSYENKGGYTRSYCSGPLTLYCLKGDTSGATEEPIVVWSYTAPEGETFTALADKSEKYIFLVQGSKTMMLSRNTGAYVATLDFAVSGTAFVSQDGLGIYFVQSNCIMRYDAKTGRYEKVCAVGGSNAFLEKGQICFLGCESAYTKYYVGRFDMETAELTTKAFPVIDNKGPGGRYIPRSFSVVGFAGDRLLLGFAYDQSEFDYELFKIAFADLETQKVHLHTVFDQDGEDAGASAGIATDKTGKMIAYYGVRTWHTTSRKTGKVNYSQEWTFYFIGDDGEISLTASFTHRDTAASSYMSNFMYLKYDDASGLLYAVQAPAAIYGANSYWPTLRTGQTWKINPRTGAVTSGDINDVLPDASLFEDSIWGSGTSSYMFSEYTKQYLNNDNYEKVSMYQTPFYEDEIKELSLKKYVKDAYNDLVEIVSDAVLDFEALLIKARNKIDSFTTVKVALDGQSGKLSKSLSLRPNETYYYEYSTKSLTTGGAVLASTAFETKSLTDDTDSTLPKYRVTGEWSEDFSDSSLNRNFTFSSTPTIVDGMWRTYFKETELKYARDQSASGTVKFTIPEGKQAIFSISHNEHNLDQCGDGEYMDVVVDNVGRTGLIATAATGYVQSAKGDYICPTILEAGAHTITWRISYRAYNIYAYQYLDNIKVTFIEPDTGVTTLQYKNGENQSYTAVDAGDYKVQLYGPGSDAAGGIIEGNVHLEEGESLDVYLGPAIAKATGTRNGANGEDGNGYGDIGTHKATVKLKGELLAVAGGGGQNGNPGTGDGAFLNQRKAGAIYKSCDRCGADYYSDVSYCTDTYKVGTREYTCYGRSFTMHSCTTCGMTDMRSQHYHSMYNGTGGTGGKAGAGSGDGITPGQEGVLGNAAYWSVGSGGTSYHYAASGAGGKGGSGGASWVNEALYSSCDATAGGNPGASACVITKLNGNNVDLFETKPISIKKDGDWTKVMGTIQTPTSGLYYYPISYISGDSATTYSSIYFNNPDLSAYYYENTAYTGKSTFSLNFEANEAEGGFLIKDLKVYYISESGKKMYVDETDNDVSQFNKRWVRDGLSITGYIEPHEDEDEEMPLVYKKGELVGYNIFYSDYENDPENAGKGYWLYAHTPFNDGEQVNAAIIYDDEGNISKICGKSVTELVSAGAISSGSITIDEALSVAIADGSYTLSEYIPRFYVDGKYTVYHWQYDDTSRGAVPGGYPDWDKASNLADITFYIEGGASAPWITSIATIPGEVIEHDNFKIKVGVDDAEKDVLYLTTEVYKDKKLIYTHRQRNIEADVSTGVYPYIYTDILPQEAEVGIYEVVCTVRDQTGAGLGQYRFIVISQGNIEGIVYHTDAWNKNRKKFNVSYFGEEVNREYLFATYLAMTERPRPRGTNVFWSGEKFMLSADVAGNPTSVTCQIKGYVYSCSMVNSGRKTADDELIFTGDISHSSMINKWGNDAPEKLTFLFTANYAGGALKTYEADVIIDNMTPYWRLHRVY